MKKGILFIISVCFISFNGLTQTVTDIDGNIYNTVTIGTQIWLKENLKVQTLNDGTEIPNITSASLWETASLPAYCNYNNTNNTDSINMYGRLYNWHTVKTNKLCPSGWHVPTKEEWITLFKFIDEAAVAPEDGGSVSMLANIELSDSTTGVWNCTPKMTNKSGFTATPSGYRTNDGRYITLGTLANFWSSSSKDDANSWKYDMSCTEVYESTYDNKTGFSVRCIKGGTTEIKETNSSTSISIYPNPFSDILYIDNATDLNSSLSIYNYAGALVLQSKLYSGKNEINISDLEQGIYVISVEGVTGMKNSKVIIKE